MMKSLFLISVLIVKCGGVLNVKQTDNLELHAITIATYESDGLERLKRSASVYGINLQVFGESEWKYNNDMTMKLLIARDKMENYKNDYNVIFVVVDAFDVMFNAGKEEILKKFLEFKADIVFGAEEFYICNETERHIFDEISKGQKYKYINAGTIMGYAPQMYEFYSLDVNGLMNNDQCVHTYHFLDPNIRQRFNMSLDYHQNIFQELNNVTGGLDLEFSDDDGRLLNTYFNTKPSIIHGNGRYGKKVLKLYENYIAKSWTPAKGCLICQEKIIYLDKISTLNYPRVLLGIFVKDETKFLVKMLQKVFQLVYPKHKIFVFIYNEVDKYEHQILKWIHDREPNYPAINYISSLDKISIGQAKQRAMYMCNKYSCDVFFHVDSKVILDNPNTLNLLISYNRSILAPLLVKDHTSYSTIYGDMNTTKYKQTFDYLDIVNGKKRGIWNVPCVYWIYVMWSRVFNSPKKTINYHAYSKIDADFSFCTSNVIYYRDNYMYAVNMEHYGHVINTEYNYSNNEINDAINIQEDFLESPIIFPELKHKGENIRIIYKNNPYLESWSIFIIPCIGVLLVIMSLWLVRFYRKFLFGRQLKLIIIRYTSKQ